MIARLGSIFAGAGRRLRSFKFRHLGVSMTGRCWIQEIEIPRNHADIHLGEGVALDRGVTLLCTGPPTTSSKISIGRGTYINRFTILDASQKIEIGAQCMVGPFCYITDHDHGVAMDLPIAQQPLTSATVTIGDDTWIGAHVTILKGVTVGSGAIIGAGSVVTKNIRPNSINAGVPTRQIKEREQAKKP